MHQYHRLQIHGPCVFFRDLAYQHGRALLDSVFPWPLDCWRSQRFRFQLPHLEPCPDRGTHHSFAHQCTSHGPAFEATHKAANWAALEATDGAAHEATHGAAHKATQQAAHSATL